MLDINVLEKRQLYRRKNIIIPPNCENAGIYVYWMRVTDGESAKNNGWICCYIGKANSGQVLQRRIPDQLSLDKRFGTVLRKFSEHLNLNPFTQHEKIINWIEDYIKISVHPIAVISEYGIDLKRKQFVDDVEQQLIRYHKPMFNKNFNSNYKRPPRTKK
jgi:hypothetical protein